MKDPGEKEIGYRPTWAEVDLDNLAYNLRQVKALVAKGTRVMACVKADAYGHGLVPVSRRLVREGVDYLAVASIDEGIKLRQAGIRQPILILGIILKDDIEPLAKYRLTTTVCDEELARALNERGRRINRPFNVHIKIDTGMGRIGVLHQDAQALVRRLCRLKFIRVEGIFTHFAFADMNREFTAYQIGLFNRLIEDLRKEGVHIPLLHAANSMGVIDYREGHFNMVRPGLVLYGLHPKKKMRVAFRPVLSLKTRVVFAKGMPAGHGISYGHDYVTQRETTVVTLPIGYGDGYPRNLSNQAPVLIRGRRFKIAGRICMDQMMVDVGRLKVRVGEEVVLIGTQGRHRVTTEELAECAGTIPYEIVCGLGSRIPRVYSP